MTEQAAAGVKLAVRPFQKKSKSKPLAWLVPAVVTGSLFPVLTILIFAYRGKLGANPISTALNQLGLVAMILLLASLACTPLKIITGLTWPLRIRKSLGLLGFFYACLHLLTYAGLDQLFDFRSIWADVSQRTFIIIGFAAFVLLVPLAVTSTSRAVRKLGKNWQRIHYLAYVIAPLVIIHFTMRMKADISQPVAYGIVLAVLLSTRVVARWAAIRKQKAKAKTGSPKMERGGGGSSPAWPGFRKFTVKQREHDVGQICSFYLVPQDGKPLPPYKPGQYLTFQLNVQGQSRPVVRCYSLSDSHSNDSYRVSIKRARSPKPEFPHGISSNFFHDFVKEGDIVEAKAPTGQFFLDHKKERPVVLIGGGVGITPVLAMLNALAALAATKVQSIPSVWFFLGVRNTADHCFREHLTRVAAKNANIKIHICYSDPLPADRLGADYNHAERVSVALLQKTLPTMDCDFYVCGPPPMMGAIKADLAAVGVPPENFHMEAFGAATVKKVSASDAFKNVAAPDGEINVTFTKLGKTVEWKPGVASLLDLAEANDIAIDFGCRAGNCGTCAVAITEGDVDYTVESGAMPEEGFCLTCVTVPRNSLTLDA